MSDKSKQKDQTQALANKSITQSGALAVQGATNNLRDINTLLATASGVAFANFIESGDVNFLRALENLNKQAEIFTKNFVGIYQSVNRD